MYQIHSMEGWGSYQATKYCSRIPKRVTNKAATLCNMSDGVSKPLYRVAEFKQNRDRTASTGNISRPHFCHATARSGFRSRLHDPPKGPDAWFAGRNVTSIIPSFSERESNVPSYFVLLFVPLSAGRGRLPRSTRGVKPNRLSCHIGSLRRGHRAVAGDVSCKRPRCCRAVLFSIPAPISVEVL